MRCVCRVGIFGLLALVVVSGSSAGGALAGPNQVSDQPETDNSITRIEVDADGSATWTITVRTRLETDDDQAAFETFQEDFEANRSRYLGPFRDNIRTVVESASNDTGREMRATNFSAETDIQAVPRRWGVVSYEFAWSNFSAVRSESVVVGNVFQSGFFIAENDTLQIVAPDGQQFQSVDPAPDSIDNGTATWSGRRDFADQRPRATFDRVVVTETSEQTVTSGTAVSSPSGTTTEPSAETATRAPRETSETAVSDPQSSFESGWILATIAGLVVVIGVAAVRLRGATDKTLSGDPPDLTPAADESTTSIPRFASDEERVLAILDDHDGEIKQAELVDTVDWSKSKVSRVLSEMEEGGRVEKLRLGRENLVRTVDDQPQND